LKVDAKYHDDEDILSEENFPALQEGHRMSVKERTSIFENQKSLLDAEQKKRAKKRRRKHLKSLAEMFENQVVTTALKETWGEDTAVGHSYYRNGILAEYEDAQVQALARQMEEAVSAVRNQADERFCDSEESSDESEDEEELVPGLMIWSWKEDGKKTEYPLDFGDALEILFRVPGTKEIKNFTTKEGNLALIDVEAMTHTYVDTGKSFPIQRKLVKNVPDMPQRQATKGAGESVQLTKGDTGDKEGSTKGEGVNSERQTIGNVAQDSEEEVDPLLFTKRHNQDKMTIKISEHNTLGGLGSIQEDAALDDSDYMGSMGAFDIDADALTEDLDSITDNSGWSSGTAAANTRNHLDPTDANGEVAITDIMKQKKSKGRIHKRAATMQLSWTSQRELQKQTGRDFTFFDEAIMSMKKTLDVHKKDNVEKQIVIEELNQKVVIFEDVISDLKEHISGAESQIGERDDLIKELTAQIDQRDRKILHLQSEIAGERIVKEEITRRRSDDNKARMEEAQRFAVMLCAMQEQLEFERLHFIQKLKEKDRTILSLKNEIFKHKLSQF